MAVLSSTLKGRVLKFHSDAVEPHTLLLLSAEGQEALSSPYRFELELASQRTDLDSSALLQAPAYVGIKQGTTIKGSDKRGIRTLKYHGVVSSFAQGERGQGWVIYRAVLVPKLWRLSLNVGCRIFLDQTVPEIVEEVLKGNGFTAQDYEMKANARPYPKREYVVQYQESDLNFLSRLLEHEGIFYFFRQADDQEKVVFGDSTTAYESSPDENPIPYRPLEKGGVEEWFGQEAIRTVTFRHQLIQSRVILRDYNYRTPSVDLKVSSPVAEGGFGTLYQYADHYKNSDEGKEMAKIRAEELKCRERLFHGSSNIRSFHPGLTFPLADHYREEFNRSYLITGVRHSLQQSMPLGNLASVSASYRNEFSAIPADEVFRPERTTPKPRIFGTMHAKVDAGGSGEYAEIDDQGRYKVQLPFDLSGKNGGRASRYMRMAQPYAGPGMGMHFPLHKGTEVILTHIDGDPDRPIIAGAMPNPETEGPVAGGNQSQCAITTGGGNKIVIEDSGGGQRIAMASPHGNCSFYMGAPPG